MSLLKTINFNIKIDKDMTSTQPNQPQTPKNNFRNSFLSNMRENIHELNRSMESIEKMIEQSRKIIHRSRENSLNHTLNLNANNTDKKQQNNKKHTINVYPAPSDLDFQQRYIKSPKEEQSKGNSPQLELKSYRTHSRSNTSQLTFGSHLKSSMVTANRESIKHQQNLLKFKPNVVKQQIELRKSGAREKSSVYTEEVKHSTPQKTQTTQKEQRKSPYRTYFEAGNTVYKFQTQKTAKNKEKTTANKSAATNKGSKIKLRPNPKQLTLESPQIQKQNNKTNQNIRIEQDDDQNQLNGQQTMIKPSQREELYRFKTQYKQEVESDFSLSNYQLESPHSKPNHVYSQPPIPNDQPNKKYKKQNNGQSYRSPKHTGIQLIKPTPRENRQMLVRELQELQTVSTTEEERRAKFILKIKKYGFVQKYLGQGQIWAIYNYLVGSHIPEIKWPIVIVDEVYKKMKSIN